MISQIGVGHAGGEYGGMIETGDAPMLAMSLCYDESGLWQRSGLIVCCLPPSAPVPLCDENVETRDLKS